MFKAVLNMEIDKKDRNPNSKAKESKVQVKN
jgi:hypothetical protein